MRRRVATPRGRSAIDAGPDEAGFTMIELVIILVILGLLLAIAVPTFLGQSGDARDRAAQSTLHNAAFAAMGVYATQRAYPAEPALQTTLGSADPELSFATGAVGPGDSTNTVSMANTSEEILLVTAAGSTCWAISQWEGTGPTVPGGSTTVGVHYAAWNESDTSSCDATDVPDGVQWSNSFPAAAAS
jgi:type IV pilus assembly protein PilA